MKRTIACGLALTAFAASAQADGVTLDSMKDLIPSVSAAGVTIYGTIDVGYAFDSHGVPASGAFYVGADYTIFGSPFANHSISTLTNNALEQSKIGVKIEEDIGLGWVVIGKIETGFNPAFGEISDACASLIRNSGKLFSQMDVNGDGSRCGQAFNGPAYAGVSNASYGTLTFGRQQSLVLDGMGVYDPMNLSYAFSILGYSGTPGAGIGSTETARWDNSVKYVYQYGPLHVAGMYAQGGQDTPMLDGGGGYGANAGFTWQGFSLDGYYTKENGAVALSFIPSTFLTLSPTNCIAGTGGSIFNTACPNALAGKVTDNQAWDIMAKYTFEFGGGLKDEGPADKLTFFGGFQRADLSNPDHPQSYYNGFNTIGGYQLITSGNLLFGSDRILDTEWAGAKYETGPWSITGAYYHWGQDSFLAFGKLVGPTGTVASTSTANTCAQVTQSNINTNNNVAAAGTSAGNTKFTGLPGSLTGSNCSGDFNQGSFLVDYTFNKHFDVYGGVSYTTIGGGLASGFLQNNDATFASGIRLKF